MRRADAYTYSDSHGKPNGDAHADGDANSYGYSFGDSDGDAHTDGDADRNSIGDPDVRAWGHTWAVEHGCTRTECAISRWWNDRWNLLLRLRWPNLYRRLP